MRTVSLSLAAHYDLYDMRAGGAEMWARLPEEDAWESWVGLRRSLSGLYCSSLDSMDETR